MGVGLRILSWLVAAGCVAGVAGMYAYRLGEVRTRTGVGWWVRVTRSDRLARCRVCGEQFEPHRHEKPRESQCPEVGCQTDTCGHKGCVTVIMRGRARMAEAREAGGTVLAPRTVVGHMEDGQPVTVRDPSGRWVRLYPEGGVLNDADRAALAWIRHHGGG